jgi:hypothetical protein
MGGVAQPVVQITEEELGTKISQGFRNMFTTSGDKFLRSLGQHGEFLADHLKSFESFKGRNMSTSRETVNKIFKEVPEQYHAELEKAVLKKPNQLPAQYTAQAQRLDHVQSVITQKAQQAGVTTNIGGNSLPLVMHPDGPFAHHPDILKPGTATRKAAITEVMNMFNTNSKEAAKQLDKIIRPQYGRNGAAHISFPFNNQTIQAGRLPAAQRWGRWAEATADKVSQSVFFGVDDIHLKDIVESIYRTKGAVSSNNVTDFLNLYQHNPAYERNFGVPKSGLESAENLLRKASGYVMTSRIAIPHATQIINIFQNEGVRNTLAGIYDRVTNWKQLETLVMESGALEEELHREFTQHIRGEQSLFEKMFHQPGFSQLRKWQASVAAIAGKHEVESASKEFLAGSKGAEATLKRLGVDTVELQRTGVLSDNMRKDAMYNAAKQTVFFRTPLNTPFKREETAFARTVFMYSHYHFNMLRTIKNSFVNSWQEEGYIGVAKAALKLGTLFPIAGGLVVATENGLYRRKLDTRDINPTGNAVTDTYLNALAHASAFGIIYSINRASRKNMITGLATGPWISTSINVGTDAADAILGRKAKGRAGKYGQKTHDFKPIGRDVLRHIPVIGPTLSGTLIPYEEKKGHQ